MQREKEYRKIVPYGSGYMSLKHDGDGGYYKRGRYLRDIRSLLNYVQNERVNFSFDLSDINGSLKKKLEDIISGARTVKETDWNPNGVPRAKI